jgi:hypothetical protein
MSPKSICSTVIVALAVLLVAACASVTSPSGAGDPMPSIQSPDH